MRCHSGCKNGTFKGQQNSPLLTFKATIKTPKLKRQDFFLWCSPYKRFWLWPFRWPSWLVIEISLSIYWQIYGICWASQLKTSPSHPHSPHPPLDPQSLLFLLPRAPPCLYPAGYLSEELSWENLQWTKKRNPLHINTPLKYVLEKGDEKWIE